MTSQTFIQLSARTPRIATRDFETKFNSVLISSTKIICKSFTNRVRGAH
eukprot:UN07786